MRFQVKSALAAALFVSLFPGLSSIRAQEPSNPAQPPYNFEREEDESSIVREREDWFYKQRAFPHEKIPTGARLSALHELEQRLAEESVHPRALPALAPAPAWKFLGPKPVTTPYNFTTVSGRVSAIAIDPTDTSIVYLGAAQGGVWKSTDGGTEWTELTDQQSSLAVGSIAIDPKNHLTIYVGTGEENFSGDSYYGAGILKSTNGGATWTHICGPFCGPTNSDSYWGGGARIGALAIEPGNGEVLLAAVAWAGKDGIYRSVNGGESWTQVLSGNPGTGVVYNPANGNIAYAALGAPYTGGTEGFYVSKNGGLTWSPANGSGATKLNLGGAGRIVIALAPSAPATLYASVEDTSSSGVLGFYKTTNAGSSWTQLNPPDYCTPQCWYDNVIAVQPTNPHVVYAGGAFSTTLIRSLDGGSTWVTLQSEQNFGSVHADIHALVFTPNGSQLLVGSDGGPYSTTQPTAATPQFAELSDTLGITQFYPGLAIDPANPNISLGGTQDNGTQLYSGKPAWNQVACGDGGFSVIDPANASIMLTACNGISIYKSTRGGASNSWSSAIAGIDTSDPSQFIPPLIIDSAKPSRLYFGTYRVYQTIDQAAEWTAISGDLTMGGGSIVSLAVAPSNSNIIYSGSTDGLVNVTANAGSGAAATWKNVTTGLPRRSITQVAVHPTSAATAYVTFSGFSGFGDSQGHVFKTTDSGAKWTDISGNLPNIPVNAIAIDPDLPNYLFVGTDIGAFYSANGGVSWSTLIDGLPRVAVLGLTLNEKSYSLRAATHGRGIWNLDVSTVVPVVKIASISPTSAIAGSAAVKLTVTGTNFSSASVVRWNGKNLTSHYVSPTTLTATIPATDLTKAESALITVYKPGTPALLSHAVAFVVKK